ncbi:MAG: hypothetical protein LC643_09295 [Bacteroidales bacterium]|nr:hypothetical protein [Bacteroidales bacterium]
MKKGIDFDVVIIGGSYSGLSACGDNASPMRSVAYAVAAGNVAGAMINMELTQANF